MQKVLGVKGAWCKGCLVSQLLVVKIVCCKRCVMQKVSSVNVVKGLYSPGGPDQLL